MLTNFSVPGDPVAKPRQTQSDKWKQRPCVLRYRQWADTCRMEATGSPSVRLNVPAIGIVAFFHFRVPESRKTSNMHGRLHTQKPDTDNLLKGCTDALFSEDKTVSIMHGYKFWCCENEEPRTDIFLLLP